MSGQDPQRPGVHPLSTNTSTSTNTGFGSTVTPDHVGFVTGGRPSNPSPNAQLFLGTSTTLGLAAPPADAVIHESNEAVDLYVVKYPEAIAGAGAGRSTDKFMVIEAKSPPKYHKVLSSFPKTSLHYCVTPQYPASSAFNREKALAQLKNSVLAAFTAHSDPTSKLLADSIPRVATAVTSAISSTTIAEPQTHVPVPVPSTNGAHQPKTIQSNTNGSTGKQQPANGGSAPSEVNADMSDFGGFFPVGTSFIAADFDDMVFMAEVGEQNTPALGAPTPPDVPVVSGDMASVPDTASTEPGSLDAPVIPTPPTVLPSSTPEIIPPVAGTAVPIIGHLSQGMAVGSGDSSAAPMELIEETPASGATSLSTSQVSRAVAIPIARAGLSYTAEENVLKNTERHKTSMPLGIPVADNAHIGTLPSIIPTIRNNTGIPNSALERGIIGSVQSTVPPPPTGARTAVKMEVDNGAIHPYTAPPTAPFSTTIAAAIKVVPEPSGSKRLPVKAPPGRGSGQSVAASALPAATTVASTASSSRSVNGSATSISKIDKSATTSVLTTTTSTAFTSTTAATTTTASTNKRTSSSQGQQQGGLQTWKKRCLTKPEKSLPTFDEATDLLRTVPFTQCAVEENPVVKVNSDALKRDNMAGKDIRAMIVSLTLTAKKMHQQQQKKKNSSIGAGDGVALGQSIWDRDGGGGLEEYAKGGGKSSGGGGSSNGNDGNDSSGKQVEWVQCDACKKWRTLPAETHPKYPSALDEDKGWVCAMNAWAPHLANCLVPEESMLSPTAIKIRVWLRRLRSGDKYESRNNLKPVYDRKTAGTTAIKTVPVDWVRCCSPLCGKWRACLRTMNGEDVKNMQYPWFCWMGTWDETKSTCSAPQEGFGIQGFHVAVTETKDGESSSSSPSNSTSASAVLANGHTGGGSSSGGGSNSRRGNGYSRSVDKSGDDTASNADTVEDGVGDDDGPPTIGISSRGRIVRSKFNVRKHLANSKK